MSLPLLQGWGWSPGDAGSRAWSPVSVCYPPAAPARRAGADRRCWAHRHHCERVPIFALQGLEDRLTFLLFDFLCSTSLLSPPPPSSRAQYTVRTSLQTTTKLAFPQNYSGASNFQLCAGLQDSTATLFLRHHHRSQRVTAGHCR